ncbi:MAG TPA: hypothetical protein VHY34_06220 [Caulobacteraceae bacterium]|jgi:hypothetical protein|nr:hypothetical protein [Caulobacteraceae bacterium]
MEKLTVIAVSAMLALSASLAAAQEPGPAPTATPNAAQNPALKSSTAMTGAPLAKGHNSFTKSEAKSRLEKAGYANVTDLTLDGDGLWQAHAMHDGQSVSVALDYKGDIAAQ